MVINTPTDELTLPRFSAVADGQTTHADVAASIAEVPSGVIDGGEIVILAIKPSMWRPLLDSGVWLTACSLCAIVLTWARQPLPGMSLVATSQLLIFLALIRLGLAVADWMPKWHILTNRRIVDIRGIRSMRVEAWPLVKIRNTYLHRSPSEKITNLGSVTFVSTESTAVARQWQSIANPDAVHAEIRKAIENAIDQHHITL